MNFRLIVSPIREINPNPRTVVFVEFIPVFGNFVLFLGSVLNVSLTSCLTLSSVLSFYH